MLLYSYPAKICDNPCKCKSRHTEYREMAFRLDGSIRHCSDNTITRRMSANASSILNCYPKGKAVAWNYYGFVKSEGKVDKATFS